MSDISYEITEEPVGFMVYALKDGNRLSMASFCNESGMQVLDLMKRLTDGGGFKPEPEDALAFFLFEDNAAKFVEDLQ